MADVDPFLLPIPKALQNDPETRNFFEYFVRWAHDIWVRTGAGDDAIQSVETGELYEPGIQTSNADELIDDIETDIEMIRSQIAEIDDQDSEILQDLLERVEALEIDYAMRTTEIEEVEPADYYHEVVAGRIPGTDYIHKFGENPDIDIASGFEAIWNGGGDYTGHNATAAETVEIYSSDANDTSAGTGARTVQVYGLDSSYNTQTETVTLNGVTPVDTVNTYIRLDRAIVRSAGTGGSNAGTITGRQKTTTANVFFVMPVGYNQTVIAAYTIPAGKKGFLKTWSSSLSSKAVANCTIRLLMRPFGEVFQVKETMAIVGAATSYAERLYTLDKNDISEKTDIVVKADSDTNNIGVSSTFSIILEDA